MKWLDITDELTPEGKQRVKIGEVLLFTKVHLKIMRKRGGKVWAKRVFLYKPEEVSIVDK